MPYCRILDYIFAAMMISMPAILDSFAFIFCRPESSAFCAHERDASAPAIARKASTTHAAISRFIGHFSLFVPSLRFCSIACAFAIRDYEETLAPLARHAAAHFLESSSMFFSSARR